MRSVWDSLVLVRWAVAAVLLGAILFYCLTSRSQSDVITVFLVVVVLGGGVGALIAPELSKWFASAFLHLIYGEGRGPARPEHASLKALIAQGRLEEAVAAYEALCRSEPKAIAPRLDLADLYARHLRAYEKAVEVYRQALDLSPSPPQAASILNRLADLYEDELHRPQDAVSALERLVRTYPHRPEARRAQERLARLAGRH